MFKTKKGIQTGFPKGVPEDLESRRSEDASFGGHPLLGLGVWGPDPMGGGEVRTGRNYPIRQHTGKGSLVSGQGLGSKKRVRIEK